MLAVPHVPNIRVTPFARIRRSALREESVPFFDPMFLGFEPREIEGIGDDYMRWAILNGYARELPYWEEPVALAEGLERIGRASFANTHCRVVVMAERATLLDRHLDHVFTRCDVWHCEFVMRAGDRKELAVVPRGFEGPYAPEPHLLAARIIDALCSRLENTTLTGEEAVDGALHGCEASIAVLSDPEGFRVLRHSSVLALGVAYRF